MSSRNSLSSLSSMNSSSPEMVAAELNKKGKPLSASQGHQSFTGRMRYFFKTQKKPRNNISQIISTQQKELNQAKADMNKLMAEQNKVTQLLSRPGSRSTASQKRSNNRRHAMKVRAAEREAKRTAKRTAMPQTAKRAAKQTTAKRSAMPQTARKIYKENVENLIAKGIIDEIVNKIKTKTLTPTRLRGFMARWKTSVEPVTNEKILPKIVEKLNTEEKQYFKEVARKVVQKSRSSTVRVSGKKQRKVTKKRTQKKKN